jgi:hypothetical protein
MFGQRDFIYRHVYCRNIGSRDSDISFIATCVVGVWDIEISFMATCIVGIWDSEILFIATCIVRTPEIQTLRFQLWPRVLSEHLKSGQWDSLTIGTCLPENMDFGQWDFIYRHVYCRNIWSASNEISFTATCIVQICEAWTLNDKWRQRSLNENRR